MALCNVADALDVLARHNLMIENLSNRDWDRYLDQSSGPALKAVGEALSLLSAHRRDSRLERFAKEATSIALIECRA